MKTIQTILTIILTLTLSTSLAQTDRKKCEIEKVKAIHDNINNLTFKMVEDFLCTFDSSCETNVEFSQWSNEMLFKLLDKEPELVIKVFDQSHLDNIGNLLDEIENPIHDFDYQRIYGKVSEVQTEKDYREKVLKSLELAADKEGMKIKK
jgi:hypothetical protein